MHILIRYLIFYSFIISLYAQDSIRSLEISSKPSGAQIYINGEIYGNTPNVIQKIQPGKYTIQLKKEGYLTWISNYVVTLNDSNYIHAVLAKKTGQLTIDCDIPDVPVYFDGKFVGRAPQTIRDIEFGRHTIQIGKGNIYRKGNVYAAFQDTVLISDTGLKEVNITLSMGTVSISSPQSGLKAAIDDNVLGTLPIRDLTLETGTSEIKLSKEGYESKTIKIQVTGGKHHSFEYALEPLSYTKTLYRSVIFPGLGQYYSDNNLKAILFSVVEAGAIAGAFVWDGKMEDGSRVYNNIREKYKNSIDPNELAIFNKQLKKKYADIENHQLVRNIFIALAALNWAANIIDAHFIGKELEEFHSKNSISFDANPGNWGIQAGFNYTF